MRAFLNRQVSAAVPVLFLLLQGPVFAAPHTKVTLETLSATTLPGIPIEFRVTIENIGEETIALPRQAFLVVRTETGERFEAYTSSVLTAGRETNGAMEIEDWPEVQIKPRERATLLIESSGAFGDPAWFRDERLHKPGRYELQVLLGTGVIGDRPLKDLLPRLAASNCSELRVLPPEGDDAAVWNAMQDFRAKHVQRDLLVKEREGNLPQELASRYSGSKYAGWILASGVGRDASESNALLKQWLEIHSGNPYEDSRWLIVARNEADRFARADEAKAGFHAKNVRDIVRRVMKPGQSTKLRRKANEILADLGDEAGW